MQEEAAVTHTHTHTQNCNLAYLALPQERKIKEESSRLITESHFHNVKYEYEESVIISQLWRLHLQNLLTQILPCIQL